MIRVAIKASSFAWVVLVLAVSTTQAGTQVFPLSGSSRVFTGYTGNTAPDTPGAYRIVDPADWYYEWPTPKPTFLYAKFKNQKKVGNNQEPGYYACRPSNQLPHGCGRPHQGLDIYAHYGTPIIAPENGVMVSYKGSGVFTPAGRESKNGGAGRLFRLRGDSGYLYTFAHTMGFSEAVAAKADVAKDFGETAEKSINVPVKSGEVVGYVGRSGGIVNPHLHLQVTRKGHNVDPGTLIGH